MKKVLAIVFLATLVFAAPAFESAHSGLPELNRPQQVGGTV